MQEMTPTICKGAAEHVTTELIDRRDDKTYWVTKLKDGNCWMVRNLDYDGGGTKVTAVSGWAGTDANTARYYDPGDPITGNYYSWAAATNSTGNSISSGNASGSICPTPWQLPTSNSTTNKGSFGYMLSQYGLQSSPSNGNYTITDDPLYFVYGGRVDSGKLYAAGIGGYYWSSTANPGTGAYNLYFVSNVVNPSYGSGRYYGFSVRCLVQGS